MSDEQGAAKAQSDKPQGNQAAGGTSKTTEPAAPTAAVVAKALKATITILVTDKKTGKAAPRSGAATGSDVLAFRVHEDGKTVTATLVDGTKATGVLS